MGLFDGHITDTDWNGDGTVDSWDDALFVSLVTMQEEDEARVERMTLDVTSDGEPRDSD